MPTEKPRLTITVTEAQLSEIEKYRYGKKMKNQTQAILSLIRMGLDETEVSDTCEIKKAPVSVASDTRAVQMFKDMLAEIGMIDSDTSLSDSDLEFLNAILAAVQSHFKSAIQDHSADDILPLVARKKSLCPESIHKLVEASETAAEERNRHY